MMDNKEMLLKTKQQQKKKNKNTVTKATTIKNFVNYKTENCFHMRKFSKFLTFVKTLNEI